MSRTLAPRAGLPAAATTPLLLLALAWGAAGLAGAVWVTGAAASWVSGSGWHAPPFGVAFARDLATHGPTALWPSVPGWAWTLTLVTVLAASVGVVIAALWLWDRHGPAVTAALAPFTGRTTIPPSLAHRDQVAALLPAAAARRAHQLRPTLANRPHDEDTPADVGLALGLLGPPHDTERRRLRGRPKAQARRGRERDVLRASWEDVVLAVMAPRAGKTTSLAIPAVLDAPGPVVATSNKADLWAATAALRASDTGQAVWTFDPQGITGTARSWWWNPLAAVTSVEEAARAAQHFIAEVRPDASGGGAGKDFWTSAAHDLLTALLLASAAHGRSLVDVYAWLNDATSPVAAQLLADAGHGPLAAALTGRQHGAPETRDGIYETARTAAACLRDPAILAWVTPPSRPQPAFDAAGFVTSRQSLYLLSKDGAGGAAPLVAALTDRVIREGVRAAERAPGAGMGGGRLDPPMIAVLDEAANVCRIADLPDLYSHLGSRGIVPITILQSYRQGTRVWGATGMDTLWSAATIKLIGAGIDDARLAEDVSRLVGDHDVTVRSHSDGDRSTSTSTSLRRQRILPPEDLRALPRGTALLLATGMRAALIALLPAYAGPRADDVSTALASASLERSSTALRAPRPPEELT